MAALKLKMIEAGVFLLWNSLDFRSHHRNPSSSLLSFVSVQTILSAAVGAIPCLFTKPSILGDNIYERYGEAAPRS